MSEPARPRVGGLGAHLALRGGRGAQQADEGGGVGGGQVGGGTGGNHGSLALGRQDERKYM